MKIKAIACRALLSGIMVLTGTADMWAQSAIYACGHMRRNRSQAITNLRNSGYTTAILFNIDVQPDGSLTTDFNWGNQQAAEAGGIICQNGEYVFGKYQPNYIKDITSLLTAPTSISRLEFCIGGWGNGSYGNIKKLIESDGTGEETMLYRNFKALHEALPQVVAVNNDQEQDYDVNAAAAFHLMLAEIGFKTTIAPYTQKSFWQRLVAKLNADSQICDIVYLQTYGGGAWNNPDDWKVFGDIPMYIGFDCEASGDINAMKSNFTYWRDNCGTEGGFLWNYNSEARNLNEWATAINRIYPTVVEKDPVATFYQDIDYGGYAVGLPVGEFTQADLALYGIQARDITSLKIKDGYKVSLYKGATLRGTPSVWTESSSFVGTDWNDKVCSIRIEPNEDNSVEGIETADTGMQVKLLPGELAVTGASGAMIELYNAAGALISATPSALTGATTVATDGVPAGIYIVRSAGDSVKTAIR